METEFKSLPIKLSTSTHWKRVEADVPLPTPVLVSVAMPSSNGSSNAVPFLHIQSDTFSILAKNAFTSLNYFLSHKHNQQIAAILGMNTDIESNDQLVAKELLCNAQIACQKVYPLCQDTGVAIIVGFKGNCVLTDGNEDRYLAEGVRQSYSENPFRNSIIVPKNRSMYAEVNSGNNLPADISLNACQGSAYEFIFQAKGGGSSNKTALFRESKSILSKEHLEPFLLKKILELGPDACPPYFISFCIGGSPDIGLLASKLAGMHAFDELDSDSNVFFRDIELENSLLKQVNVKGGVGCQLGGSQFVLGIRILRMSRHAASVFISRSVSCVADRCCRGKIDKDGVWIEELDETPQYIMHGNDSSSSSSEEEEMITINLSEQSMAETCMKLSTLPVGTAVSVNGPVIVARDIAHMKWREGGEGITPLAKKYPIFYAGPAKTPHAQNIKGKSGGEYVIGSIGPTTSNRMDSYVEDLMKGGYSRIMIGKGKRSDDVVDHCKEYKGFYLVTPGGIAATVAQKVVSDELVQFGELGMEAVRKIVVRNLRCVIAIDDKGGKLY